MANLLLNKHVEFEFEVIEYMINIIKWGENRSRLDIMTLMCLYCICTMCQRLVELPI